jgi:hypothetical protein
MTGFLPRGQGVASANPLCGCHACAMISLASVDVRLIFGLPMRLATFVIALSLTGCAAAQIGFTPSSGHTTPDALKPFNGGSVDAKGVYVASDDERALSCGKLTGSMHVVMSRLKDSGNRPRAGALTTGIQAVAKPFAGQGANLDIDEENKQARARLKAYNELLAEKKCKTVDISGA